MSQRLVYQNIVEDGMKALGGVYVYVSKSGLPKSLLDLCFLRASQINGCSYCIDIHTQDLLKEGATASKLMLVSVWREASEFFTEQERAALAWTETVTKVSETSVPDEDFDAAYLAFDDKEISDLTIAIGLINAYNRLGISFRRGPENPPIG